METKIFDRMQCEGMFGFGACIWTSPDKGKDADTVAEVLEGTKFPARMNGGDDGPTLASFTNVLKSACNKPKDCGQICHSMLLYCSGNGGCDPDVYLLMADGKKFYIKDMIDILSNKESLLIDPKYNYTCFLFFEITLQEKSLAIGDPRLPSGPKADRFVIATSGLQKPGYAAEEDETWTCKLAEALFDDFKNGTVLNKLAELKKEFLLMQYIINAGQLFQLDYDLQTNTYYNGVMITSTSSDKSQDFETDERNIATTFGDLRFKILDLSKILTETLPRESDTSFAFNLPSLIKAITCYEYSTSVAFLSFYYSGYGGMDEDTGRIYFLESKQKYYIDDIVSLFMKRKDSDKLCIILLELCLPEDSPDIPIGPLLLPAFKNIVVAVSGLHKASVCRTPEKEGKWTKKLCEKISEGKEPLAVLLDEVGEELPEIGGQYVYSCPLFTLKNPPDLAIDCTKKQSTVPISYTKSAPANIMKKRPRPRDAATLLGHVAYKWKDIGKNLGVSNDNLQNLEVMPQPDVTKLMWMINKADNLTWASLYTGVYNVDKSKADEMKAKVMKDSAIFSNYHDN
ncbi:PREDICTED: uncharacterized protein LOC109580464 isoform X3 [Amphimedon queenslandica]|uniref:Uncharacterized protein n=1 Tax=Amphimedon queenslandica TaxID=400682 RepID=A0AAN0IWR7_AMPQE|nr:PREDICTED: uncharacterized protein LOC109580464 isoform X2 [Amphimedon queenslandica]XP_019849220.1 PREDICTED: uncharacterized protein LOC109580464 isoform X3 [Amphimedon queenslandica]|eukprot:XP_019849219.1 PREDICTED: uncharacterized protein LOC109580464 isoform X2 [Amphimedon queenslandica]